MERGCQCPLDRLLDKPDVSSILVQGSQAKEEIQDMQRVLFETGYGQPLQFDTFGADGDYGPGTTKAVKAFANNNEIQSDGTKVTNAILKKLLAAHHTLDHLFILFEDVKARQVQTKYRPGGNRISIMALQCLLNDLGFGDQLQFERFGADGDYGPATTRAVKAFADQNGIASDGHKLTPELADRILATFRPRYGEDWMTLSRHMAGRDGRRALVVWAGSRFVGKAVRADKLFVPLLEKINGYAEQADVFVFVTSSFRTSTNVQGAIVTPARRSNHLVGHAIDMNVQFGPNRTLANSNVLRRFPNVPAPVGAFLQSIIDDEVLRWGGQFTTVDPVHIDDALNIRDRPRWKKRFALLQETAQGLR